MISRFGRAFLDCALDGALPTLACVVFAHGVLTVLEGCAVTTRTACQSRTSLVHEPTAYLALTTWGLYLLDSTCLSGVLHSHA